MFKVNNHKIEHFKLKKDLKIIFMSDLHFSNSFSIDLENKIINKINDIKPNYIFITGDIIDTALFLDEKENRFKLISFLEKVSQNCKTFIVFGSHDLNNTKDPSNTFNKYIEIWKEMFKGSSNIYILDNELYEDDYLNIIGINLSFNYYHDFPSENVNLLIKEINSHNFKPNPYKSTILLLHTPRRIFMKNAIKNINLLKQTDLILSGHMHDGVVPKILKKLPTSIGFISPQKGFFPRYARGKVVKKIDNHRCTLLVTGGVTKVSPSLPNYIKRLSFLYDNEIEYIILRGKNG